MHRPRACSADYAVKNLSLEQFVVDACFVPSKVRHEATCSLRQHYLDAAASQGRKPTPVPKLSDPLLTLLDRKPQKQKGKGKGGTIPARFRYRIAKLKDIAQKQTDSFVLLQAVAGTDLLHQSHGFLATAKLVQKASAVFFSKLVAVQRLEKDLKRQCGPPNNEVPSWPGLAGTLPIRKNCSCSCGRLQGLSQRLARLYALGTFYFGDLLALFGSWVSIFWWLWKCSW